MMVSRLAVKFAVVSCWLSSMWPWSRGLTTINDEVAALTAVVCAENGYVRVHALACSRNSNS